jgi:hypothetical protein
MKEKDYIINACSVEIDGNYWEGAFSVNERLKEAENELENIYAYLNTLNGEAKEIALLSCENLKNEINMIEYFIKVVK